MSVVESIVAGGGEAGALMRSVDWASTPLGPMETWPQSLRTTVSLCLSSTFPILIAWGPERVQIYNDAYRPICGELHPKSMGQRFNECWASALPAVGHVLDRAQSGTGSYIENLRMFLDRYGYLEEAFMTFSFSPIRDESGGVGGLFHPITETTDKMLSSRRTEALQLAAAKLGTALTLEDIGAGLAATAQASQLDVPFLAFYSVPSAGEGAKRVRVAGLPEGHAAAPAHMPVEGVGSEGAWGLGEVWRSRSTCFLEDVDARFPQLVCEPYPEPLRRAAVMPIQPPGHEAPVGFLIAGVSARRALDGTYRAFYEQLGQTVTNAVANVLAYEQEQKRTALLAELDRAKTTFFSNVSHEFRTPLTLLLGPLEELLGASSELPENVRHELERMSRNGQRLLKLVNSLLDFSRIEGGKVQTGFERLDFAQLTVDLASNFRSLLEKAGLKLVVDCPPLSEPLWVDREMVEKIVLNLLSNAFKFTFAGGVTVTLREKPDHVQLSVADTGTGIPPADLPLVFERFHRVHNAKSRSFEGTGIGLALVHELVRLHGGSVQVESALDKGTTFTVTIPRGNAHLPPSLLREHGKERARGPAMASVFVEEARQWLDAPSAAPAVPSPRADSVSALVRSSSRRGRVVVADDNADMRDYITRLLGTDFEVEAVGDGRAALEAVRRDRPDVVLSDVMMPILDGFGVLDALRSEGSTSLVPVILLSARAGEEARAEGLSRGAADYLVKPFHARELIARVEGAMRFARAQAQREEAYRALRQSDERYRLASIATSDAIWDWDLVSGRVVWNDVVYDLFAQTRESMGEGAEGWIDNIHPEDRERITHSIHEVIDAGGQHWRGEYRFRRGDGSYAQVIDRGFIAHDAQGKSVRMVGAMQDVSESRRLVGELQARADFEQQLIGIVSHDLRNPLGAILMSAETALRQLGSADEKLRKPILRIRSAGDRAARMIRDLLDFTLVRHGEGLPISRAKVELKNVVETVMEELHAAHPERVVDITVQTPVTGVWDADRIAQALGNLISNALQYSPPGSPVKVDARMERDDAVVRIANDGAPIAPALMPQLFTPLKRGAILADNSTRSVGLGLYIVKHIVEAHGGTVSVESAAGQGTAFTVRLPSVSTHVSA